MREIQVELEGRERNRELFELLTKAKRLLLLQSYDEAVELLEHGQREFTGAAEVSDMLNRARSDRSAYLREARLNSELSSVKDLMRSGDFRSVVTRLCSLREEFPHTAEIRDLLDYAQEQVLSQQHAEEVDGIVSEARTLVEAGGFDAAIALLEQSLKERPNELGLTRYLQTSIRERALAERIRSRGDAMQCSRNLAGQGNSAGAVEILNEYSNRYGADHEIRQLQSELEKSATHQKREQDILSLIADITAALNDDRLETASHIAVGAEADYPDETRILVLVEQVRAEFAARQKEAALEGIVRDVASLAPPASSSKGCAR
jgi:hypothetical protein